MTLVIVTAHAGATCAKECMATWGDPPLIYDGTKGMLQAYQSALTSTGSDVLAYLHDDVLLREPPDDVWKRVLKQFDDPTVGLVGFGGALQHGTPDLYKKPYDYHQLGRSGYRSNTLDAEVHGERFTGECDVAVLDGFALIVRRCILEKAGGWPINTPVGYVAYDYWLCCEAHRQGYRIRLVGVGCHHLGGRTAVALKKAEGQGEAHEQAHRWLWERYPDVLPWRCE